MTSYSVVCILAKGYANKSINLISKGVIIIYSDSVTEHVGILHDAPAGE